MPKVATKKVVECTMCNDAIEPDDKTKKVGGVVYHEECSVAAERAQAKTGKAKPPVDDDDEEEEEEEEEEDEDDDDEEEEDDDEEEEEEEEDDDEDDEPVAKAKKPVAKSPPAKGKKVVVEDDDDEEDDDEDDDEEEEEPVVKKKVVAKKPVKKPVTKKKVEDDDDEDDEPVAKKGKKAETSKRPGPPRKNYADESEWGNPATPGSGRWAMAEAMHAVTKKDLTNAKGPGSVKNLGKAANAVMAEYWKRKENRKRAPENMKDCNKLSIPWFISSGSPYVGTQDKENGTYRITGTK